MLALINFLSLSRIFIGMLIFTFLMLDSYLFLLLFLFIFAGLSDYFDGLLARKYNATSTFGEVIDPIADKILIIFIFFGLALNLSSYLIGFAASLIISREIWVSALRDLNARKNNTNATKVMYIAKIKTTAQLFTILIYLIGLSFSNMLLIVIGDILIIISLLITLYTGFIYTINTFNN